jgi:hypothetical protein
MILVIKLMMHYYWVLAINSGGGDNACDNFLWEDMHNYTERELSMGLVDLNTLRTSDANLSLFCVTTVKDG